MSAIASTVKLHLNARKLTFLAPLAFVAIVAVFQILFSLVAWRAGSEPGSAGWIQGSRSNFAIAWVLVGFLVYLGVASVAMTLPFALSLGATRRAFVAGTLIWNALASAYIAVLLAVLTAVEIATDHWFTGVYIFDVYALGAGGALRTLLVVFLGALVSLTVGGVFAAAWVRIGALGPQLIGGGVLLILLVTAIIVVPDAAAIIDSFQLWWLAVAAVGIITAAGLGSWAMLRSAVVR